jgi:hypothetical protein
MGIRIYYKANRIVKEPIFVITIYNTTHVVVSSHYSHFDGYHIDAMSGGGYIDYIVDNLTLTCGSYFVSVSMSEGEVSHTLDWHEKMYLFTVMGRTRSYGLITQRPKWYHQVRNL